MRRDIAYLVDMLHAATLAMSFVEGMRYAEFAADAKTQAAVIREFEIIGEAAGRVSDEFQSHHLEVPWAGAISMRNRMIHGYDSIDLEIVWQVLHKDIPDLIAILTPLVPTAS
jgi:uncharacterized protein with HEPN domain